MEGKENGRMESKGEARQEGKLKERKVKGQGKEKIG